MPTVGIVGSKTRELEQLATAAGLRPVVLQPEQLAGTDRPVTTPDVVLVDVRDDRNLLSTIGSMRRRYPAMGVAIVAASLEPELMLEAMRAGVTECLTEPLTQSALEAAIGRVMGQRVGRVEGRVFALIGAKGGVGTTTIAVNLAEALARRLGDTLIMDLHTVSGDAAVFLGVEPRFTITEALENTHRLDEAFFRGLVVRTPSGLDLLGASPRVVVGPIDPRQFRDLMDFAVRHYQAIVLDVPRESPLIDALDASSVFVVVNHELPTIRSAYRLVAKLRQRYASDRISLVVNRTDRHSDISLSDIEKAANAKVKHVFPSDYKQALAAMNKGEPLALSTQGRLAGSFDAFAAMLTKVDTDTDEGGGLFGWLAPRRSS
jgi:pilus assembly protein CpaE